jgi:hypothetical protein
MCLLLLYVTTFPLLDPESRFIQDRCLFCRREISWSNRKLLFQMWKKFQRHWRLSRTASSSIRVSNALHEATMALPGPTSDSYPSNRHAGLSNFNQLKCQTQEDRIAASSSYSAGTKLLSTVNSSDFSSFATTAAAATSMLVDCDNFGLENDLDYVEYLSAKPRG